MLDDIFGFIKAYRSIRKGDWRKYELFSSYIWLRNTELGSPYRLLKVESYE